MFAFLFGGLAVTANGQQADNVYKIAQWHDPSLPTNNSGVIYNECWGFVQDGKEYGVIGSTMGAHIIEVTEDNELIERDYVPGNYQGFWVIHRDYHAYNGYLYAIGQQGTGTLQIMDLRYLPDSVHVVYDSDSLFDVAHNIYIDESSAIMYILGPDGNAMSLYSLADPENPEFIRHFNAVIYVHDCFVRNDTAYLNAANQGLHVWNFADPHNPVALGSLDWYPDQGYNHSGWLSEDGKTYVFADETEGKRMKVCDVSDLTDIRVLGLFNSGVSENTIPHNLMLANNYVYVSHYNDGLQIFDITDPENPFVAGYYDTFLEESASNFRGAWGIYSFLPSGRILISDRHTGLYAFQFRPAPRIEAQAAHGMYPNPMSHDGYFWFENPAGLAYNLHIYDATGREARSYYNITENYVKVDRLGLADGLYTYRLSGVDNTYLMDGKFVVKR